MRVMAIDPGASGGLAIWRGGTAVEAVPMPATTGDLVEWLVAEVEGARVSGEAVVVYVEKVGGFIKGRQQPGSAMFAFGFGAGAIEGAVLALAKCFTSAVHCEYVRPQDWQKYFHLGTAAACGSRASWKNKLKAEAQRRYAHLKVTLATADALLLLDYGRARLAGLAI